MKKVFVICFSTLIFMASCVQNSKEYKQMKAENDSLKIESTRNATELNEMLAILNDVEEDILSIREAENYLTVQSQSDTEMTQSKREQIKQNMQMITETLKKNKQQISELEAKLKNSNVNSASLRRSIERLNAEMDQKTIMITSLQEDLAKKNVRIQELDEMVAALNEDVEVLATTTALQTEALNQQDRELHTAYYCFGTSKELKDQNILTGGGLFSKSKALEEDFNRDYFISIDIREVKQIPLFAGKAKLRSNHPDGTWELQKDEEGNLTFVITNEELFWSLGKYLVIQVS
ncbi:chromosome segregation ATPase [Parabacteroides sp. PFB2-12]|uniref:Cbp1 family collagen-binding glycoprotein adhesin n=1 Tax=unclassified Parabacteroides TaxID=2649774 RepID=UPI00247B731A|nr:chromosome segregation ATPase [Parabacteroides sp. PM6-13]MDH6391886.1 chromosome segregation ATPase [Parabacteroides sp. PFB2-12]